jgi:hypothetical protein
MGSGAPERTWVGMLMLMICGGVATSWREPDAVLLVANSHGAGAQLGGIVWSASL